MSGQNQRSAVAKFACVELGHWPTPFEPLDRLSDHLGGPQIFIKRDDCSGLATGGNKTCKLEFLMADALAKNADIVITQGAIQSNHARQTAAAAAKCGLDCILLLEERLIEVPDIYQVSGNILTKPCGRYRILPLSTL